VTKNSKEQKVDFTRLLNKPKPTAEEKAKMQQEALAILEVVIKDKAEALASVIESEIK
jgi:hypothetical protein